ncbi:MAG: HD domain-containing protein [bacterium]|nr:HD domain-containing protein [bacterium]
MSSKNDFYVVRETKFPQPIGHPVFIMASPILQFVWQASHIKHVFRSGMLKRRVPAERCETTADHTAVGFIMMSVLVGKEYNPAFRLRTFEQWSVHDLAESGPFGDTPPGEIPEYHKKWMEHTWFKIITESVPGKDRLRALFAAYDTGITPEAIVDKQTDKLEAVAYSVPMSWRYHGVVPERFIERRKGYFSVEPHKGLYEEIARIVMENPPRRMQERTYARMSGRAKHPRPCDLPMFAKASPLLQFVWQASNIKHVYNPRFLHSAIPPEKRETVGDHITGGLSIIVSLFGGGCDPCKRLRIYELWAVAHLDDVLLEVVGPRIPGWGRIKALVVELREGKTEEAQIVRQLGPLETALYAITLGWHIPEFDPWPHLDRLEGFLTVPAFVELYQEARTLLEKSRPRSAQST